MINKIKKIVLFYVFYFLEIKKRFNTFKNINKNKSNLNYKNIIKNIKENKSEQLDELEITQEELKYINQIKDRSK